MAGCGIGGRIRYCMIAFIEKNDIKEFSELLRRHDINIYLHGTTPIHAVCMRGRKEFLLYLIDQGAILNSHNCDSETPIMICIKYLLTIIY